MFILLKCPIWGVKKKKRDFVSAQGRIFKCCTTLSKSHSVASNPSTELRNAHHRGCKQVRYDTLDSGLRKITFANLYQIPWNIKCTIYNMKLDCISECSAKAITPNSL